MYIVHSSITLALVIFDPNSGYVDEKNVEIQH